ncbi:hypothetical protein ACFL2T_03925 [Elusimicrobiota bacterium]
MDYIKRPEAPDWFERGNLIRLSDWDMAAQETVRYNVVQKLDGTGLSWRRDIAARGRDETIREALARTAKALSSF